jgi:hypothetical protein
MDYYNLSEFSSIEVTELISKFHSSETIKMGVISVFGDSVGKPGDTIYTISSITQRGLNEIVFDLGELQIIVSEPIGVIVNEKVIGISKCSRIEWLDNDLTLEYTIKKNKLHTRSVEGNHIFRVKENRDALMIYTW